jgi:hypothetical protein
MADNQKMHNCTLQNFQNFMGCSIKGGTVGIDPLVIMTETYTQNCDRISYELTGLFVEIVQFICEKINLNTVFLAPSLNVEMDWFPKEITELDEGLSEVLIATGNHLDRV